MSKDVKDLEETLEVLKALSIVWVTINRIKNSLLISIALPLLVGV